VFFCLHHRVRRPPSSPTALRNDGPQIHPEAGDGAWVALFLLPPTRSTHSPHAVRGGDDDDRTTACTRSSHWHQRRTIPQRSIPNSQPSSPPHPPSRHGQPHVLHRQLVQLVVLAALDFLLRLHRTLALQSLHPPQPSPAFDRSPSPSLQEEVLHLHHAPAVRASTALEEPSAAERRIEESQFECPISSESGRSQ
jgi:hypothetical protein